MKIALLANLKTNAPVITGAPKDLWDDLDSMSTIDSIHAALNSSGHTVEFMEANIHSPFNLIGKLQCFKPDLCFNLAEGHVGDSREAQIPALLEMLDLPYTGSKVLTLALAQDKPMTKRLLYYHDLPTPEFQVFCSPEEPINEDLAQEDRLLFPLFVKPSREGTGMGTSAASIVRTVETLRSQLRVMFETYNQPILCERFVYGRELTVGILGNLKPTEARRLNDKTAPTNPDVPLPEGLTFFPPLEIDVHQYSETEAGIYSNRVKVDLVDDFHYTCPAVISTQLEQELYRYAAAVFQVTGCRDMGRVDFRIDAYNGHTPYILEINPLPGLNPTYSDLCIEAYAGGWDYVTLINSIVDVSLERHNNSFKSTAQSSH